jgi:hypothetical protein
VFRVECAVFAVNSDGIGGALVLVKFCS